MSRNRRVVGVAVPGTTGYGRQIMRGVMRYANLRRRWVIIQELEVASTDPENWPACDGAIVAAWSPPLLRRFLSRCRHVVSCSGSTDAGLVPVARLDDAGVGRMAAEHLTECGLRHFGYYGAPVPMSERRLAGFCAALRSRGHTCQRSPVEHQWNLRPHWERRPHWPELAEWVRGLPKPAGIFTMDDAAAADLAALCLDSGIPVPERVAILGVNNDDMLCETAWPPLSSIATGYERVGEAAARLLERLLRGEKLRGDDRQVLLPALHVARRASTDVLAVDDDHVAESLRFIREHACDPCSVTDVLRHVPVNRRWLERQFVRLLGRTLHDEIIRVKMDVARRLLAMPHLPMTEVAEHSGFASLESFSRAFHQRVGTTPAKFRRRHAESGGATETRAR